MRVYLDNCCYNRPFDPQDQTRVQIETVAKLAVQFMMATGRVEYVWSAMLDYEISFNPSRKRRETILRWKTNAFEYVAFTEEIRNRAIEIQQIGVKEKDSFHIACAEFAGCDWVLTTDDRMVKKAKGKVNVKIGSPVDFIMENKNENV